MKRVVYWFVSITILATVYTAFFLAAALTGALTAVLKRAADRLILMGQSFRRWALL